MAAVIHIRNLHAPDESSPAAGGIAPPALRVLEGGRSSAAVRMHRIYLVRRLVAATVLALLVVGLGTVGAAAFGGADSGTVGASPSGVALGTSTGVHVVQAGDTLWSIASSLDPAADPRDMVRRLLDLNASQQGLGATGQLRIGQELHVPTVSG
jgi:hypothetical protein